MFPFEWFNYTELRTSEMEVASKAIALNESRFSYTFLSNLLNVNDKT